jgi:hypothetical protein
MAKRGSQSPDVKTGPKDTPWLVGWAIVIVVLGIGWRLTGITEWPSGYHLTRQYFAANRARQIWFDYRPGPRSEEEEQWYQGQATGHVEPPIMETLTAWSYLLDGRERPWFSSVLASVFWLAGGGFVFGVANRLSGDAYGALLALAFYLLTPLGIALSRSFQPEALMILGLIAALWCLVRVGYPATWRATAGLGAACALAILVKPGFSVYPLLFTFGVIALQQLGWRGALSNPKTYGFVLLALGPAVVYSTVFLSDHVGQKLLGHLLFDANYYRNLWSQINAIVGWYAVAAAVIGACLMVRDSKSFIGLGLLASYMAFCATFTWHAMTHSYYHCVLIVIVSVCIAPLVRPIREAMKSPPLATWQKLACSVVLLISLITWSSGAAPLIAHEDRYEEKVTFYTSIGELCGKGTKVLFLGEHYGEPFKFHAMVIPYSWPMLVDKLYERTRTGNVESDEDRLTRMIAELKPEYFVVADRAELARQPGLAAVLSRKYRKVGEGPSAVIFELAPTEAQR